VAEPTYVGPPTVDPSRPFQHGVSAGFDACVNHYGSVSTLLRRALLAIIIVGVVEIVLELMRLLCYFKYSDRFETMSSVSSGVGFVGMIITAWMTGQVASIALDSGACSSGFLLQGLPGCAYVNMGVVSSAEAALVSRISQCVSLFVAKPVFLGLHSAFTFMQQLPHFGCRCK
jgi:hypothetical protein